METVMTLRNGGSVGSGVGVNGIISTDPTPTSTSTTHSHLNNHCAVTTNNNLTENSRSANAAHAMQLLEEGKLQAALQVLNLCLGDNLEDRDLSADASDFVLEDFLKKNKKNQKNLCNTNNNNGSNSNVNNNKNEVQNGVGDSDVGGGGGGLASDESMLIEKRCLVNMRLKRFHKVIHDAKKMLDYSGENSVAYKCLLAALCKMKKMEQASEVIRLWQKNSPRDLDMMECRTKLESLMVAVKNGIEASDAFSDVEELLGLNYDWLLLRKSKDPQWKFRPLPTSSRCSFVLCLQYRFGHCSLGEKCPDAHGEGELEEWKKRFEIENVSKKISNLKVDDGSAYIKDLLAKIQGSGSKKIVLSDGDDTDEIKISCVSPLCTTVQQRKFKKFTWKFTVKTQKPLEHICLLHEHHRQYFHISSCSFVGPKDSVVLKQASKSDPSSQVVTPQLSEAALAIAGNGKDSSLSLSQYTYKVKVVFTPEVYGNFRQSVVFDIGRDLPKVSRNLAVDVVPPPDNTEDSKNSESGAGTSSPQPHEVKGHGSFRSNIPWNFGNAEMIDGNSGEKMPSEKLGFALIGGQSATSKDLGTSFMENGKDPLSKAYYKERMRFLLTQEERARQEILAKYNVTTNVQLSEKYMVTGGYNEGMTRYAVDGALFGRINLFRDISEDTAVGRLILRSCNAVLLTKSEESRKRGESSSISGSTSNSSSMSKLRVYFCTISDKSKNSVFIDLGRTCVSEQALSDGDTIQFDIQFQLDRTAFIEQKKVMDQLEISHLDMLFPDLEISCNIPWSPLKQWGDTPDNEGSSSSRSKFKLNPKQKEALIAITADAESCKTPPILVIGPFGSGKTFTLAQCIRRILVQNPRSRVMVCTHSNSAADLYIKEYLHSWVRDENFEEARPLRIYYEMRNLSSVHPTVLEYCTIEAMKFRPPSYDEVMNHRVIVVTLSTSYLLMEMNLPSDTFSHILLDEAAQAMESEAITPLMSAGPGTKLVLAGDHFQLSPELFSEEARNIHPSLLERLHALYPDTHPCKLMLCENYRSHSAIIQFVSDSFYTKKLECAKSQPVHPNFYPLTFFAARGEDCQDSESTSYYNMAEVFELTEKISELISSWPEKWGDYRDENAIGVLTPYADQVTRIRGRLRKKGLHSVSVERVFNVQGKQFRAVFLSTVRTFRPWVRILPEAVGNEVDLGFFSSPKLLNTALTRAQSLVAVVGDPVSLCSVGKCRGIWEDYIRICHESKSLFGMTFLQLKQSILGVEMRLTWGLNPLANEFQPQSGKKSVPTLKSVDVPAVPCSSHHPASVAVSLPLPTPPLAQAPVPAPMPPMPHFYKSRPSQRPFGYHPDPITLAHAAHASHYYHPEVPYPIVPLAVPAHPHLYRPGIGVIPAAAAPAAAAATVFPAVAAAGYYGHGQPPPLTQPWGVHHPHPAAAIPPAPLQNSNLHWPNATPAVSASAPSAAIVAANLRVAAATAPGVIPQVQPQPPQRPPQPHQAHYPYHSANAAAAPPQLEPHPHPPQPPPLSAATLPPQPYNFAAAVAGRSSSVQGQGPVQTQSQFATGQPLYRRQVTINTTSGVGLTSTSSSTQHHPSSSQPMGMSLNMNDHHFMDKQSLAYLGQSQNVTQTQSAPKLTQEELNFISRALESHASSGEPFYGDLQSLRSKLMQAALSSSEIRSGAQSQPQPPPNANYPGVGPMTENYSGTGGSGMYAPAVPQQHKSPGGFPASASSGANALSNRVWSHVPNDGGAAYHQHQHAQQQQQTSFGQSQLDGMSMRSNQGHGQPSSYSMDASVRNAFNQAQVGTMPPTASGSGRPLPSHSQFPDSSQFPGYQSQGQNEIGGGVLKAQLSGGIRQGFTDRSAFSRVNVNGMINGNNQDLDVVTDSSGGLAGRSYANVVKAAVTQAVGAGVATSTFSNAPVSGQGQNLQSRHLPPTLPVPGGHSQGQGHGHGPIPNAPYSNLKYLNPQGSTSGHGPAPGLGHGHGHHGHFGP